MGIYFEIVLKNIKTEETKLIETWTLESYYEAWDTMVERAIFEFKKLWKPTDDNRYWVIESITDVTRR